MGMGTCENGSSLSLKHRSHTHVSVTELEKEKEHQTLVKGFQEKLALNESDNLYNESCNLEDESCNLEGDYNSNATKYDYPLRPYAQDCPYYLRTGCCKFGFHCKFNHPMRTAFQGVKEKETGWFAKQPGQIQCKFYLSTGGCKYGLNCKFSHSMEKSDIPPPPELSAFSLPVQLEQKEKKSEGFVENKGQIECKEKESKSESSAEKTQQIECKYHLSAGGCKYGNACKFSHSNEESCRYVKKSVIASPKLNFLGLPIRMLEKECPFYMRNGSCKFGLGCRFNHPDPVAVGQSDSLISTPPVGPLGAHSSENCDGESDPLQLIKTSQPSMESWSSEMTSDRIVPYLDNHSSHAPGMHLNSNWTRHEESIFPNPKTRLSQSFPAVNNVTKTTNVSTYHQQEVDDFPERPGQPECDYFMKTGNCRYRSACKFHHPKNQASKSSICTISNTHLPLRPDKKICWNYERYGNCKYGHNCLFDHPENSNSSTYASGCNTATFAESEMAGFGSGNKNLIQQSV